SITFLSSVSNIILFFSNLAVSASIALTILTLGGAASLSIALIISTVAEGSKAKTGFTFGIGAETARLEKKRIILETEERKVI
ncbi:unnamed protein product, partial [marine sediment metagenome]